MRSLFIQQVLEKTYTRNFMPNLDNIIYGNSFKLYQS